MKPLIVFLFGVALVGQQRGSISYDQVKSADRKGTGAQFQMYCNGTSSTTGQAAVYDVNGNVCPASSSGGGGLTIGSPYVFPRYQAPIIPFGLATTAPVTVANSNTATTILGSSYFGSATIPAGWAAGKTVRIHASGLYGSTATPTLTIDVILGGVTIASLVPTILGSTSNDGWELDYSFTATDLVTVIGAGCFKNVGTAGAIIGGCASGSTNTLNFGTAQTLDLKATWSAASSSNTITSEVVQVL